MGASIWDPNIDQVLVWQNSLLQHGRLLTDADPTGGLDSSDQFLALFTACVADNLRACIPGGTYKVSKSLLSTSVLASGNLHIYCLGEVTILVDPASVHFDTLIPFQTTAPHIVSIIGGKLSIDLANKVSTGIYCRHYGADGGSIRFEAPVKVQNAKSTSLVATTENQGILIYGRYLDIYLNSPEVIGVDRANISGGACKGISINEFVGPCVIDNPKVSLVLCTGSTADADGISVFGRDPLENPALYGRRLGTLTINAPIISDCQGRSIKTQISQSTIINPKIYRKNVVAFATADIDHQVGGIHNVYSPEFDWQKNGAIASVPVGFYAISFQARGSDVDNRLTVTKGTLLSSMQVDKCVALTVGPTALASSIVIDGFEVRTTSGLAAPSFSRGFLDFNAAQVEACPNSVNIEVRNTRIKQSGGALVSFSNGALATLANLSVNLVNNTNTGADNAASKVFSRLSGAVLTSIASLLLRDNPGYTDYMGTWNFNTQTLPIGTRFAYDRATSTVTNGPTIAAGTYCTVECLGSIAANFRTVKISVANGATMSEYYTQFGGVSWGLI
jgi:hypothetical protein